MRKKFEIMIASALIPVSCVLLAAEGNSTAWDPEYKRFSGKYQIYAGSLTEMSAPKANHRKAAFAIKEPVAKDLFDALGPDLKAPCSSDPNYRERQRGDLSCVHTREDGYTCYFGFDLRTGKSIAGATC